MVMGEVLGGVVGCESYQEVCQLSGRCERYQNECQLMDRCDGHEGGDGDGEV